jgi:uncharacterized damage-inducible protein DinB
MERSLDALLEVANAEFSGNSLNGHSFMETLESLSPGMAAYDFTYEGYSAWEVAHHVAYFKHRVTKALDPSLEPYPLPKGPSGFAAPLAVSDEAWRAVLDYLKDIHARALEAIRKAPASKFDEPMPKWEVSIGEAVAWLCTHDLYHTAQLRNMGVPGLKEPKES